MTGLLFAIAVLAGLLLWYLSSLPGTRIQEHWARLCFLIAGVIYFLPLAST